MAPSPKPIPDLERERVDQPFPTTDSGDGETYGRVFRLASRFTQWLAANWSSRQPRAK